MGSWHGAGGTRCPVLKLPKHHAVQCGPGCAVLAAPGPRGKGCGQDGCGMREPAERVPKRRACCYGNGS